MCDTSRCNWCGSSNTLQNEKPYCRQCSLKCFQECKRCTNPYPNPIFFTKDAFYCNACFAQREKQAEKRLQEQKNNRLILFQLQPSLELQIQRAKIPVIKPIRKKPSIVIKNGGTATTGGTKSTWFKSK